MHRENYEKQLTGQYLETYEKIKGLTTNLSFFMNDDHYYEITILEEVLDLLLEAQEHHQPIEYVLGDDLEKFMYLRYKECALYSFSYGGMVIVFCFLFYFFNRLFPNVYAYHFMETEYYIFLLLPFVTKILYLINQNISLKIFFRFKKTIREYISYGLFAFESMILMILIIYGLFHINPDMVIYNVLFFSVIGCIVYRNRKNQDIGIREWISRMMKSCMVYTLFVVEITLFIMVIACLSHYISPLITTGTFQWFIPILICVYLTVLPLRGLNKKSIHYHCHEEELLDQYLSHCQFLITKRKITQDIPLTYQDYFIKLQKKHHIYRKLFPLFLIFLLISFVMFMTSFQFSLFYMIIIGYTLFGLFNLYKYLCIVRKIDKVCDLAKSI